MPLIGKGCPENTEDAPCKAHGWAKHPLHLFGCWPGGHKKKTNERPTRPAPLPLTRQAPVNKNRLRHKLLPPPRHVRSPAWVAGARKGVFPFSPFFLFFHPCPLHSRRPSAVPAKTLPQIASAGCAAYLGRIQARRQRCFVCH